MTARASNTAEPERRSAGGKTRVAGTQADSRERAAEHRPEAQQVVGGDDGVLSPSRIIRAGAREAFVVGVCVRAQQGDRKSVV